MRVFHHSDFYSPRVKATELKKHIRPHLQSANLLTPDECSLIPEVHTPLWVLFPHSQGWHRGLLPSTSDHNWFHSALSDKLPLAVLAVWVPNGPQFPKLKPILKVKDLSPRRVYQSCWLRTWRHL